MILVLKTESNRKIPIDVLIYRKIEVVVGGEEKKVNEETNTLA